jgi:4-carboxymuconolactone decarboxylase
MDDKERLDAAKAARRAVIGADEPPTGTQGPDSVPQDFQDFITLTAWGTWARGGPLSHRDRSLLVLAMTAALGRMEEFRVHVDAAPRAGVSDTEWTNCSSRSWPTAARPPASPPAALCGLRGWHAGSPDEARTDRASASVAARARLITTPPDAVPRTACGPRRAASCLCRRGS